LKKRRSKRTTLLLALIGQLKVVLCPPVGGANAQREASWQKVNASSTTL